MSPCLRVPFNSWKKLNKASSHLLIGLIVAFIASACKQASPSPEPPFYKSPSLEIQPLSLHTFVHLSYLKIRNYGLFPCNGLIVVDQGEAMIFDTPTEDSVAVELINWIENELSCKIKGVVINHFHDDCLGGLAVFHQRGIPSFANATTIDFAKKDSAEIPLYGFKGKLELSVGDLAIHNTFFGEGHSRDNIVSYVPADSVLFGGCMVKEVGAGKGNLADANIDQWPQTVARIKAQYPNLQYIVPGHGKVGGVELLDFTIEMFTPQDTVGTE